MSANAMPGVAIPALTFAEPERNAAYAERIARTWADLVLVAGTYGEGSCLDRTAREALLDVWQLRLPADRLLVCCWDDAQAADARARSLTPLVVVRDGTPDGLARLHATHGPACWLYAHPGHGGPWLTGECYRELLRRGLAFAGLKASKVGTGTIRAVTQLLNPETTQVWHGSARNLRASAEAGARGCVAAPLAALPDPFPHRTFPAVQQAVDAVQRELDRRSERADRVALLKDLAAAGR